MNAPAIIVLLTQAALVAWFCLLGAFAGSIARRSVGPWAAIRVAMWLGLGLATLTILVVGLLVPTKSAAALGWVSIATLACALAWLLVRVRRGRIVDAPATVARGWWVLVPIGGLVLLAFATAHLAFGPVSNYDTGLYHLNAIQYASDYPTIHGLANLHPRLGTNVSAFDLAAFLSNTAWGADAFRMLAGVFLLVLSADVALRLLDTNSSARRLPGTYVLLVSLAVAVPGLLQLPNYNVTGSSPDTIALALTLAAGAYLADALLTRERSWIALAVVSAVLAASVRTQLWVLVAVTVAVLVINAIVRRRSEPGPGAKALVIVGSVVSGLVFVAMMVRDVVLSGWLLFPMTYVPVPVAWKVPQVTTDSTRDWLMSWARDRAAGPEQTLTSWYWVPEWLRASVVEWSVVGMIGLLAFSLIVWLATRRRDASGDAQPDPSRYRLVLLLSVAPAVVTVLAWFVTAPDPRFAWGPLLLVGAIPAAFVLQRLSIDERVHGVIFPIAAALLGFAVVPAALAQVVSINGDPGGDLGYEFRTYSFGPIDVVASVANLPIPTTRSFTLVDGTVIQIPTASDQCYDVFPLCTPYESSTLRLIGDDVSEGFRSD